MPQRCRAWCCCRALTLLLCVLCCSLLPVASGEAAEARRAERRRSRTREDRLLLLARPPLQHQRERNLGSDDSGAGQPQGVAGECESRKSNRNWAVRQGPIFQNCVSCRTLAKRKLSHLNQKKKKKITFFWGVHFMVANMMLL